jgi:hypothetical protein
MGRQLGPDQGMVVGQDLGVGLVTDTREQCRRALDVGEEEGERLRASKNSDSPAGKQARICRPACRYRAARDEEMSGARDFGRP